MSIQDLGTAADLGDMAHLVFIGLLVDEPELDEIDVMQWLGSANEAAIVGQVGQRLLAMANEMADAMGVEEEDDEEEQLTPIDEGEGEKKP